MDLSLDNVNQNYRLQPFVILIELYLAHQFSSEIGSLYFVHTFPIFIFHNFSKPRASLCEVSAGLLLYFSFTF